MKESIEKVDQTISAVSDWIQKNLKDAGCMGESMVLPEMVKALAELVSARVGVNH